MKLSFYNRARGSLLGLMVADALGAPVEFKKRGSFPRVTEFLPGGEFNLLPGQWTDDTSLCLCLMESLTKKKDFDLNDQMNLFLRWWKEGYLSSKNFCFDIGNTTKLSMERFLKFHDPLGGRIEDPATNGAIMRLAPVTLFYKDSLKKSIEFSVLQTRATHGASECLEASMLLSYVIYFCLEGKSKEEILKFTHFEYPLKTKLKDILIGNYKTKNPIDINAEGLAFNTLEAALYAFYKFDNFMDGLFFVVNLGDDSDTVGAVYGQIAGAYYGVDQIEEKLIVNLYDYEKINKMILEFIGVINAKA